MTANNQPTKGDMSKFKAGNLIKHRGVRGPASVVTFVGSEYLIAIHPDHGPLRIYDTSEWERWFPAGLISTFPNPTTL